MMHPDSELKYVNSDIGFGVFAAQRIPKGTITYVFDELEIIISECEYQGLKDCQKEKVDWFSYRDVNNNRIISWDHAKYVNHCCHANTLTTAWGFEIAVRDIEEGEEITDDYGLFMGPGESIILKCALKDCRGIVSSKDRLIYGAEWDRKISDALGSINMVNQPLYDFIPAHVRQEIISLLKGTAAYKSINTLFINQVL